MFCQSLEGLIAWAVILVIIVAILNYIAVQVGREEYTDKIMYIGGAVWFIIAAMFVLSNSGIARCDPPTLAGLYPGSVAAETVAV